MLVPVLSALLPVLSGCAGARGAGAQQPSEVEDARSARTAQTYYLAGEAAYEDADYGQAAALWKRAVIELPRRPAYDGLRHKLLVRVGHGQLMAYASTGDQAYLDEGIAMLEAYAERHTQLLGDTAEAQDERGQVFELIGEMEVAREDRRASQTELPEMQAETPEEDSFVDPHADEILTEDGLEREVRVRGYERPDVNDPVTRAKLASPFANDLQPGVLTRSGSFSYEPRALVRLTRLPLPRAGNDAAAASRVGRSVVSVGRRVMQDCYAEHLSEGTTETAVRVQISVADDGAVTLANLASGSLGSEDADACLVDGLETVQLAEYDAGAVDASLDLMFFLDVPRPVFEMAVQPFGPFDQGDPANTMPPTDLQSDGFNGDYRGMKAAKPLPNNRRRP